jgi:hypothetical protein
MPAGFLADRDALGSILERRHEVARGRDVQVDV